TLLEVGVNNSRRLWCGRSSLDRPRSHLIRTTGEEMDKLQGMVTRGDDLGHHGLSLLASKECLSASFIVSKRAYLCFKRCGEWNDLALWVAGLDPLVDLRKVLVFLQAVLIVANVDEVHHRLGRQELLF